MTYFEQLLSVFSLYEQLTGTVREKYGLTRMEFNILMFLYNNPRYTTAGDIIRVRQLTKSHVSSSVASLEQKGLLSRSFSDGNRKSIHLSIMPTADAITRDGKAAQDEFQKLLTEGFSLAELCLYENLFSRMCGNAQAACDRRNP